MHVLVLFARMPVPVRVELVHSLAEQVEIATCQGPTSKIAASAASVCTGMADGGCRSLASAYTLYGDAVLARSVTVRARAQSLPVRYPLGHEREGNDLNERTSSHLAAKKEVRTYFCCIFPSQVVVICLSSARLLPSANAYKFGLGWTLPEGAPLL